MCVYLYLMELIIVSIVLKSLSYNFSICVILGFAPVLGLFPKNSQRPTFLCSLLIR